MPQCASRTQLPGTDLRCSCHPLPPQIHYNGKQAFLGRLSRQPAAVAADLVVVWQRHCLTPKVALKVGEVGLRVAWHGNPGVPL